LLHIFVWSKDNDHKQRVVNKAALSKHLNILFKLRNDLLSLNLSDIKFFEALQEILIFESRVLVILLFKNGDIKFKDFSGVLKSPSISCKIALDIEIEHQIIILQGLKIEGTNVALD
jgi:hypothetical protein